MSPEELAELLAVALAPQVKSLAASAWAVEVEVPIFLASAALEVLAAHAVAEVAVAALEALAAEPVGLAGRATWQSLSIEHESRLGQSRGADLRGAVGME